MIPAQTGTITKGKPEVTDLVPAGDFSEQALLLAAAAVERGSEHPLGRAIVECAETQGLALAEPQKFEAIRGKGVSARVDDRQVLVGSRRLMREYDVNPDPLESELVRLEDKACICSHYFRHGRIPKGHPGRYRSKNQLKV